MKKIEVGKYNTLQVEKFVDFGLYLKGKDPEQLVLLPKKEMPKDIEVGDTLEVFIYRDSEDRLIATTRKPYAVVGELAHLEVKEKTKIGAFLDFGLERDILLPHSQQPYDIREGQKYLVKIYVDKSDRLCATAKIEEDLTITTDQYQRGDEVKGVVYKMNPELGVFVAVDNQYYGLIPKSEIFQKVMIGDELDLRIAKVREDGKLDVSPRKLAYVQRSEDAEKILVMLEENAGFLPLHDKSDPELIKKKLQMSKAAFKRAVGGLMKEGKVRQDDKGMYLL